MTLRKLTTRALLLALGASTLFALPAPVHAGGFYLLDRGTRPLGRGGAMVAGADDPGASLWYNPAGLGLGGEQLVIDGTMTFFNVDYTRIDGGGTTQPTVHGSAIPLPIPTLAGSFDFGLENVTFGVGIYAPNAALMTWPESLTVDGQPYPAPQRYSLLSMEGSLIATLAFGAAWRPIPELSIGAAVHVVYGAFAARVAMSACDGAICSFPEDPDYDGVAQLTLNPAFTAVAVLGATLDVGPVRFGASVSSPYELAGDASIQVRLPAAAAFEGAQVVSRRGGDPNDTRAHLDLDFPWVIRFGVQLDAIENLALELAVVWETWSVQREAAVEPLDVWIEGDLGFVDYQVGPLSIPRNMRDTVSVRLGGEYSHEDWLQLRAGAYYENGAFDDQWLQALTIDSDKIVVAIGGSIRVVDGLWVDAMLGYAHLFPRQVRNSQVPQANPIRPPQSSSGGTPRDPSDPVFVGNGDYSMIAPFAGLGIRFNPDWVDPRRAPVPEEVEEPAVVEPDPTLDTAAPVSATELTQPEPTPEPVVEPTPEPTPMEIIEDDPPPRPRGRGRGRRHRTPR